jgi:hypothetical protein
MSHFTEADFVLITEAVLVWLSICVCGLWCMYGWDCYARPRIDRWMVNREYRRHYARNEIEAKRNQR